MYFLFCGVRRLAVIRWTTLLKWDFFTTKKDGFTEPTALESDGPYFEIMGQWPGLTINLKACTRWVSFDIKFTWQGFENACWHLEACRAIQQAFSKPSQENLISKDTNLVFYLSAYQVVLLFKLATMTYFSILCWFSVISDVIKKCNVIMTW